MIEKIFVKYIVLIFRIFYNIFECKISKICINQLDVPPTIQTTNESGKYVSMIISSYITKVQLWCKLYLDKGGYYEKSYIF